jgi:multiple sugar transport system permease protein
MLPSILGLLAFFIVPFIDVVRRSFMNNQATEIVGADNYSSVIFNEAFWIAAGNTFKFIAVCVPLLVVFLFF